MHALVIVAVIIGVIFVSLACLLSVWSDLHTRIEFPALAQPYDDEEEEPYGDTSAIPGFADESNSALRRS
jgi:hypothetical protein